MQNWIQYFLSVLPEFSKDEADLLEEVLHWDEEKKMAFLCAKKIFEENCKEADD